MKVSDQIRLHLEEAISNGSLLPGDAIDEVDLAERFSVSRTPVREALIQLQAQGWVSNLPRGGPIVAKMNLQQLLSLWEL
ncbi:MAG: GntR protein, partial [Pseudomonadota bacterium]